MTRKKSGMVVALPVEEHRALQSELQCLKDELADIKANGCRRRLPAERKSISRKFRLPAMVQTVRCTECKAVFQEKTGPEKMYAIAGFYEDGKLGELFLRADKAGTLEAGILDAFATAFSIALQHGAPLKTLVSKIVGTRFEPAGLTRDEDPRFKRTTSPLDLLGRWLREFVPKDPDEKIDQEASELEKGS